MRKSERKLKEGGGMGIYVYIYVADSLYYTAEINTTL